VRRLRARSRPNHFRYAAGELEGALIDEGGPDVAPAHNDENSSQSEGQASILSCGGTRPGGADPKGSDGKGVLFDGVRDCPRLLVQRELTGAKECLRFA